MSKNNFTVGGLFAGVGGIELGFEKSKGFILQLFQNNFSQELTSHQLLI